MRFDICIYTCTELQAVCSLVLAWTFSNHLHALVVHNMDIRHVERNALSGTVPKLPAAQYLYVTMRCTRAQMQACASCLFGRALAAGVLLVSVTRAVYVLHRFLYDNQLSGTLPTTLGTLKTVSKLYVHHVLRRELQATQHAVV